MLAVSILVFLLIFSIVVLIHEWGHFSSARRHGVHVEEFGLGMPPRLKTLWEDAKGCKYTLNWIPFGGFIRMEGEDDLDESSRNKKGSFASKPLFARMEIVLAGVFMNFVLAIAILTVLFSIGTQPILLNMDDVNEAIDQGVIVLDEGIPVVEVLDGPAKEAGLQAGDLLLAVNGQAVDRADQIPVLQEENNQVIYSLLRTNEEGVQEAKELTLTPDEEGKVRVIFAHMPALKELKNIQLPVHKAFLYSIEKSADIAVATVDAFKKLLVRLVTKAEVPEGISGPVGIAAMTHGIVQQQDIHMLFKFMALLSLSLAIMNVLPIPALDGGRFLFLVIEALMRRPIKAAWENRIHSFSYLLLLGLIFIVTWNDIGRIFGL